MLIGFTYTFVCEEDWGAVELFELPAKLETWMNTILLIMRMLMDMIHYGDYIVGGLN